MNHKRKKPKNARAGCLMCKPHKSNDFKDTWDAQTIQEKKAEITQEEFLREYQCEFLPNGKGNDSD